MDTTMIQTVAAALAAAVGAILLTLSWRGWRRGMARKPERARRALACAGNLVELIAQVQQHRGMSGAWLAGDAGFKARLPEKQAAVQRLFAALIKDAAKEDAEAHPCFVSHDVKLLRHQWQVLVEGLAASSPEQNFQTHCRIVATLLDWLGALGETRIEQPLAGLIPPAATRNFSHRLPVLAECIGQARALGSTVAAKKHCPPVSRVRLLFLLSRAESLLGQALDAGGGRNETARSAAKRAVDTFVATLRDRLLSSRDIQLSASDCFTLGTRAADGVFGWLESERREVDAALARPAGTPLTTGAARRVAS